MTSTPSNPRDTIAPYFTEFLSEKLHQPLLPKLKNLSAVFYIELTDATRSVWTLAIKDGMLESIAGAAWPAQCGFKLTHSVFALIVAGTLSPQVAFFKRDVEIEGDIALGLKLATVLAEFFKRFPWSS